MIWHMLRNVPPQAVSLQLAVKAINRKLEAQLQLTYFEKPSQGAEECNNYKTVASMQSECQTPCKYGNRTNVRNRQSI